MPVVQDAYETTAADAESLLRATEAADAIVLVTRLPGARRRRATMQRLAHGSWLVTP
jgi:hypothetical protein